MVTKSEIMKTLLIVWFMAATGYVAYDLWTDYAVKGVQRAYQSGVENTVNELMKQVEGSNCESIEVFNGEKKLQVLDAKCVSIQEPAATEQKK